MQSRHKALINLIGKINSLDMFISLFPFAILQRFATTDVSTMYKSGILETQGFNGGKYRLLYTHYLIITSVKCIWTPLNFNLPGPLMAGDTTHLCSRHTPSCSYYFYWCQICQCHLPLRTCHF